MDAKKFSDAYVNKPYLPPNESESQFRLMESSRAWSQRFGNVVLDILSDKKVASDETIYSLQQFYLSWGETKLAPTYNALQSQPDDASDGINEINYHLLNIAMLPSWIHLAKGSACTERNSVETTQNRLATIGVNNVMSRLALKESNELFVRDKGRRILTQKSKSEFGATNEIDTAITLLEIANSNPSIIIVPSPDRFEHGRSPDKNIDFIVYDTAEHQARGVQAKTTANAHNFETYDRDYVTLVDGENDLDNRIAVNHSVGNNPKNGVMSWPGLISAHYLLAQKSIVRQLPRPNQANIHQLTMVAQGMRLAKWQAKQASMGTRSSNKNAAKRVKDRVISDLYR